MKRKGQLSSASDSEEERVEESAFVCFGFREEEG